VWIRKLNDIRISVSAAELCTYEEDGGERRDGIYTLLSILESNSKFHLNSEFCGDRTGGDSQDFWAWSENPEKLRKTFESSG
tara:strand:- start:300 stop:545 length:246 start_codon:yes stop_codon:yes gene_type:complete